MKVITTLLFLFFGFLCYSQNQEQSKSLDPRQFVKVYYHKSRSDLATLIGEVNQSNQIFYQRIDRIDKNGIIEIKFLLDKLTSTPNFYGAISIQAEVYGRDGSRKIEVNPYSLVGQDQTEFGIKSISINDLYGKINYLNQTIQMTSKEFYDLHNELIDMDSELSNHLSNLGSSLGGINWRYINLFLMSTDSTQLSYLNKNKTDLWHLSLKEACDNIDSAKIDFFFKKTNFGITDIDNFNSIIYSIADKKLKRNISSDGNDSKTKYLNNLIFGIQEDLTVMNGYLNSILNNSEDSKRAFSVLTGYDEMTLNTLKNNLDSLAKMNITGNSKLEWYNRLDKMISSLTNLSESFNVDTEDDPTALKEKLSSLIFNRLVNAQIDLNKENVQPGEKLNIYLLWNDSNKQNESTKLNLCSFYVDETGAQFKIMDAFYLVERINQGKGDSLQSPSNFKGAGGASLMLSYYRNDLNSRDFGKSGVFWGTMNSLQPSIGLNVSYLDFDVSKDFEIGTGLCLGFFRNQLMFTYGINLHKTHENWYNASYFGVGFSFINIADNIRDKR